MKLNNPLALSAALAATSCATLPTLAAAWSMGPGSPSSLFFQRVGASPSSVFFMDSPAARLLFDDGRPCSTSSSCAPSGGREDAASSMMESPWHQRRRRHNRRRDNGRDQLSSSPAAFYRSSPRYEIAEDESAFQLAVDVPGVTMEDINVSLEDGNMLTVTGSRSMASEKGRFTSRFSQSFSLDASVDVDKISARLENGVLVVTAPKDLKRLEANVRKIPISAGAPSTTAEQLSVSADASSSVDASSDGPAVGDKMTDAAQGDDNADDEDGVLDLDETAAPKEDDDDGAVSNNDGKNDPHFDNSDGEKKGSNGDDDGDDGEGDDAGESSSVA